MKRLHPLLVKSHNHCSLEGEGTQPQSKMQLHRYKPSTPCCRSLLLSTATGSHLQTTFHSVKYVYSCL